jgi:Ca2+-binding RTX toxin-like protein
MTGGGGDNAFVFFHDAVGGAADIITDFNANDAVYTSRATVQAAPPRSRRPRR